MWDLTVDVEDLLPDGGGGVIAAGGALRPDILVAFHY
jgi:hypothetical protein